MVKPKKKLGQHFLTDPAIAERVVDLLPENSGASILEIGPGKGILTEFLLRNNHENFLAVDLDQQSIDYLRKKYPENSEQFIAGDFLKLNGAFFDHKQWQIIGNFPYNISSQIFFRVLQHRSQVESVVCMIQKEVADRIVSPPGSKTYGILSVLLQCYFTVRQAFNVKPGSFFPPPKVQSSVITLNRHRIEVPGCNEELLFKVVKATFNQRRKMIRNSLKSILLNLEGDNHYLSKRPEQLGFNDFIALTNWVEATQQQPE